jgi:hypothetical protein
MAEQGDGNLSTRAFCHTYVMNTPAGRAAADADNSYSYDPNTMVPLCVISYDDISEITSSVSSQTDWNVNERRGRQQLDPERTSFADRALDADEAVHQVHERARTVTSNRRRSPSTSTTTSRWPSSSDMLVQFVTSDPPLNLRRGDGSSGPAIMNRGRDSVVFFARVVG